LTTSWLLVVAGAETLQIKQAVAVAVVLELEQH
jgi:hypothetical protein